MKRRDFLKQLAAAAVSVPFSQSAFAALQCDLPSHADLGCGAEILRIKRSAEAILLSVPGVTGVAVGFRQENGVLYDEESIRVYSRDRRLASQLLPKEIDGAPVSIVDGDFRPAALPQLPPDEKRYPTLKGGMMIINPSTGTLLPVGAGTLGAIVQDVKSGDPLGLSCFHVVGVPAQYPYVVWQATHPPSVFIAGIPIPPDDSVGAVTMVDWPRTKTAEIIPKFLGTTDAAVFSIKDAMNQGRQYSKAILDHPGTGELAPFISDTMSPFQGQTVRKRGFKTRLTNGLVLAADATIEYDWFSQARLGLPGPGAFLVNQAEILGTDKDENNKTLPFCEKGDSGSVVLDAQTDRAVGLLWGVNNVNTGMITPIKEVESRLGIRMVW
jgi:hypothetical protein